jgi:hypothetical protein
MFFGRVLNRGEIGRLGVEREEADRAYNDALTAVDQAIPTLADLPHPPPGYDESQVTLLNERWQILDNAPIDQLSGWRRRAAAFLWPLIRPLFERQQSFNATLVDHVNRNVAVHRATRDAIDSTIATLGGQLEALATLHNKLILYLQSITLYVDTKDHSESLALMVNGLAGAMDGVSNEFLKRSEAMLAREQRFSAAVGDVREALGTVERAQAALEVELGKLTSARADGTR